MRGIHQRIDEVLSDLEQEVLAAYLDGKSYQEIADNLGRHVKSIDNALQRVKRKLERYLEDMDALHNELYDVLLSPAPSARAFFLLASGRST